MLSGTRGIRGFQLYRDSYTKEELSKDHIRKARLDTKESRGANIQRIGISKTAGRNRKLPLRNVSIANHLEGGYSPG